MKAKMMSIMVMFCILIAIHEEMSVEAGLAKGLKKLAKKLEKCCAKFKCRFPDTCVFTSLKPVECVCNKHGKVNKKQLDWLLKHFNDIVKNFKRKTYKVLKL